MSVPVIWNASAGEKRRGPTAGPSEDELRDALAGAGIEAHIVASQSEDEARRAVEQAVAAGEQLIVAAGGDGTVGSIAAQLLETDVVLGVLPLGSVMNIGRALGVPRELEPAAKVLAERRVERIDVGEANGRLFFETASVGINAAVFRAAQHFEDGDWGSPLRAAYEAFRYRPARMEIELDDGRQIQTRALLTAISNAPFTGVGLTVAPDARLDDGLFDVRIFRHFSKWELLRHMASIAFGRRAYSPHVDTHRAASVRVSGRRQLPCRADAQDLGTTPLECRVRPASLSVVVGPSYARGRALDEAT